LRATTRRGDAAFRPGRSAQALDHARREHAEHERGGESDHHATDDEGGEVVEGASLHAETVPRSVGAGGRFDCAGGMRSLN
jgi:hypothetical protein